MILLFSFIFLGQTICTAYVYKNKPAQCFPCHLLVIVNQTGVVKTYLKNTGLSELSHISDRLTYLWNLIYCFVRLQRWHQEKANSFQFYNLRALAFLLSSSTGSVFTGGANLDNLAFFLASSSVVSDFTSPNLTNNQTYQETQKQFNCYISVGENRQKQKPLSSSLPLMLLRFL